MSLVLARLVCCMSDQYHSMELMAYSVDFFCYLFLAAETQTGSIVMTGLLTAITPERLWGTQVWVPRFYVVHIISAFWISVSSSLDRVVSSWVASGLSPCGACPACIFGSGRSSSAADRLSRRHFTRVFKKHFGLTPSEFLRKWETRYLSSDIMEFVEFYPVNKIFTAEMTFIVVLRKFRKTPSICRKLTFRRVLFLYHRSPYYHIRTSKLKPKPRALKFIRFSFNRNKKLVTGSGFCLNLY